MLNLQTSCLDCGLEKVSLKRTQWSEGGQQIMYHISVNFMRVFQIGAQKMSLGLRSKKVSAFAVFRGRKVN